MMSMLAESVDAVIGVDTHTDTHTACLLDAAGREIATVTADATPAGYTALLAWAVQAHGAHPRLLRLAAFRRWAEAPGAARRRRPAGRSRR